MNKHFLRFLLLMLSCNTVFAKPVFTKAKYLIATLSEGATGTVSLGTEAYPLVYYVDRDLENVQENDYWMIKDQGNEEYTFQNAVTLKYVKYDVNAPSDRSALVLVTALEADKSTSFKLELKTVGDLSYYLIRSVLNPSKVWNKRNSLHESLYPVGVYGGGGSPNECVGSPFLVCCKSRHFY